MNELVILLLAECSTNTSDESLMTRLQLPNKGD
jgi:hypothetical protein